MEVPIFAKWIMANYYDQHLVSRRQKLCSAFRTTSFSTLSVARVAPKYLPFAF